jgi:hypothetical protein
MPSNYFGERVAEIRATAEASMVVKILGELSNEPSTKRFTRSRAARVERWLQLERVAKEQSVGLLALGKVSVKRPARVKGATPGVYTAEMPDERRVENTSVPIVQHADASGA